MARLSGEQVGQDRRDGVLAVEDVISASLLGRLRAAFEAWVEESRRHDEPYGRSIDGCPRFDLQPPSRGRPAALRRVQSPTEISDAYYEAMADSATTDMVADLVGPNVKFHHAELNSKLPGSAIEVPEFPQTSFFAQQSERERVA